MKKVIIIGAGPAGLSCAYSILKENSDIIPIIIEELDVVGGLSRTIKDGKIETDIGPHRFFTKNIDVQSLWEEILPLQTAPAIDDIYLKRDFAGNGNDANPEVCDEVFLKRKRFSRIYYRKHFIDYPIKMNLKTILALGIPMTIISGMSYMKSVFFKVQETNLETFMVNRFGKSLYELFFEGYTEKVWGVHPSQISKEWGSQRIKGISILSILKNAVFSLFMKNEDKETSLIDEYIYPKLGSSQFYESLANKIEEKGGKIIYTSKVVGLKIDSFSKEIKSVKIHNLKTNEINEIGGDYIVSSMPVKDLILAIEKEPSSISPPKEIVELSKGLLYRDFILVNFVSDNLKLKNNTKFPTVKNIAPDSWIYLQDKGVKAGRLDIMNNFSPYMIKDFKNDFVINLEYFCNEDDDFWKKSDDEIINFAISELLNIEAIEKDNIKYSKVHRIKKAYPSYFGSYEKFDEIKKYLNTIPNLYCIGRNGQHKYNNMDHSLLSGLVAGRMIVKNESDKDSLWDVNTDSEYQEIKTK